MNAIGTQRSQPDTLAGDSKRAQPRRVEEYWESGEAMNFEFVG